MSLGRKRFGLEVATLALVVLASGCVPSYSVTRDVPSGRTCPLSTPQRGSVEIAWYHPQNESDARDLERWCQTVGAPVFVADPSRDPDSAAPTTLEAGTDLVVATWNLNAGAGELLAFLEAELGYVCGGRQAPDPARPSGHFVLLLQEALRRGGDIPPTSDLDVVPTVVAEAERDSPRRDVVDVARSCGLSLLYAAAARNGPDERDGLREEKGNAILSTLPLSAPSIVELPFEGARRVTVVATATLPSGHAIRFASLHFLSAAAPWRILTTGNASRFREASGLMNALRAIEASEGGLPTVAAGDFNTWSRHETALKRMRGYFVDSPPPLDEPTRGGFPTDHVMFRGISVEPGPSIEPASYRRVRSTYNSDHHPLVAVLSGLETGG